MEVVACEELNYSYINYNICLCAVIHCSLRRVLDFLTSFPQASDIRLGRIVVTAISCLRCQEFLSKTCPKAKHLCSRIVLYEY